MILTVVIFSILDIIPILCFGYALRCQYKVFRTEENGLRNSRKAMMIYIAIMLAIVVWKAFRTTILLIDNPFLEGQNIFLEYINKILFLILGIISCKVYRGSSFEWLSLDYWKNLFS